MRGKSRVVDQGAEKKQVWMFSIQVFSIRFKPMAIKLSSL